VATDDEHPGQLFGNQILHVLPVDLINGIEIDLSAASHNTAAVGMKKDRTIILRELYSKLLLDRRQCFRVSRPARAPVGPWQVEQSLNQRVNRYLCHVVIIMDHPSYGFQVPKIFSSSSETTFLRTNSRYS